MPGVRRGANTSKLVKEQITETYTLTSQGQDVQINKEGYKIISITQEMEYYYGGSEWGKAEINIRDSEPGQTLNYMYNTCGQVGNQRGYDYHEGLTYGGVATWNPTKNPLVSYASSSTTKSNGAMRTKITMDGVEWKVGKTYGNWLQTGSGPLNSTWENVVSNLFNGTCWFHLGSGGMTATITYYRANVIVTYQKL